MATKSNPQPVYELRCGVNSYPWGKTGSESAAARLCEKQKGYSGDDGPESDFSIDSKKPYAEMWMGDYPVLPSYVKATGQSLQELIDENPEELLGKTTLQKFGDKHVPFLPKVLSIAKALPLQLHPNKSLAAELHRKDPQNFTDPNHKPEIALALTKFEAFCGFKELRRIDKLMQIPALQKFLPPGKKPAFDDQMLKGVVNKMLKADDKTVQATYSDIANTSPGDWDAEEKHIPQLAPRLAAQYSEADPGVLVALITMNYLVLQPGDSIYIPADGIHAYLAGDIIECMARSNNVLNTGFCPRAERNSADLFCSSLTFSPHSPEECILKPSKPEGKTKVYSPPISEFDASESDLHAGDREKLSAAAGSRIVIVTRGDGAMQALDQHVQLSEGQSFFVKAGVELSLEAGKGGVLVHTFYNN